MTGVEVPPDRPGLAVIKRVSVAEAEPGDTVTYVIIYRNMGNTPINNVSIVDSLLPRLEYVKGTSRGPEGTGFSTGDEPRRLDRAALAAPRCARPRGRRPRLVRRDRSLDAVSLDWTEDASVWNAARLTESCISTVTRRTSRPRRLRRLFPVHALPAPATAARQGQRRMAPRDSPVAVICSRLARGRPHLDDRPPAHSRRSASARTGTSPTSRSTTCAPGSSIAFRTIAAGSWRSSSPAPSARSASFTSRDLNALAKKFESRGVDLLAINSNASESAEDVAEHARLAKIQFPVLKDPENRVADLLLAERTCEALVIDRARAPQIPRRHRRPVRPGIAPGCSRSTTTCRAIEAVLAGTPREPRNDARSSAARSSAPGPREAARSDSPAGGRVTYAPGAHWHAPVPAPKSPGA